MNALLAIRRQDSVCQAAAPPRRARSAATCPVPVAPRLGSAATDWPSPVSVGDMFALVAFLVLAAAMAVGSVYAAHHALSEISRYSALDMIRMLGGLP